MERVFRIVSSVLDGVSLLVTVVVILGGGVVGGFLAWLSLLAEEAGPLLLWSGAGAGALAGAFLTWVAMKLFSLLGVD